MAETMGLTKGPVFIGEYAFLLGFPLVRGRGVEPLTPTVSTSQVFNARLVGSGVFGISRSGSRILQLSCRVVHTPTKILPLVP